MSRWCSADPVINDYLNGKRSGGVYNSINLDLFHYAGNNPVKIIDPDGRSGYAVKDTIVHMIDDGDNTIYKVADKSIKNRSSVSDKEKSNFDISNLTS